MKKLFILFYALLLGIYSFAIDPGNIDKKVLQVFDSSFPNAKDVSWQELKDSYEVYFIRDGMRHRVLYSKDHSYLRITRYYNEETLPQQIRFLLKETYVGKSIFGITEVSEIEKNQNDKKHLTLTYYVRMEDAKTWLTVKVNTYGETTVLD